MRFLLVGMLACGAGLTGIAVAQVQAPPAASAPMPGQAPGADGAPPASSGRAPPSAASASGLEAGFQGPLILHFELGSAAVRRQDEALLDQASRLYREGRPLTMILTGGSDAVGTPEGNLRISQMRTASVLRGLVSRGIPAERFQLLAKGETDPIVPGAPGAAQPENRRVEIRWR